MQMWLKWVPVQVQSRNKITGCVRQEGSWKLFASISRTNRDASIEPDAKAINGVGLLANLVLSKKHIWDAASNLVDVLAVRADHLTFDYVNLLTQHQNKDRHTSAFLLFPLRRELILTLIESRYLPLAIHDARP